MADEPPETGPSSGRSPYSQGPIRLDAPPRRGKRRRPAPARRARSWALPGERLASRLFDRMQVIAPSEEDVRGPLEWERPRGRGLWEESLPAVTVTVHGLFFAFTFLMLGGGLPNPGSPGWYALLTVLSLSGLTLDVAWLRRMLAAPGFHEPRRRFGFLRVLLVAYVIGHAILCGLLTLIVGLPVFVGLLTGQL